MKRTQSTPAQKYVPPAEPQTTVRTVSIPPEIVFIVCFGRSSLFLKSDEGNGYSNVKAFHTKAVKP